MFKKLLEKRLIQLIFWLKNLLNDFIIATFFLVILFVDVYVDTHKKIEIFESSLRT